MNRLIRDFFFASALGALLGWAIGTLIRRHRERQAIAATAVTPPRPGHAELNTRWQGKRPNSIG
jgi:chorismate synthase